MEWNGTEQRAKPRNRTLEAYTLLSTLAGERRRAHYHWLIWMMIHIIPFRRLRGLFQFQGVLRSEATSEIPEELCRLETQSACSFLLFQ